MSLISMLSKLRSRATDVRRSYVRFTSRFVPAIRVGSEILGVLSFVASLAYNTVLLLYFGFEHTPGQISAIRNGLHTCQVIFIVEIIYNLALRRRFVLAENRAIKWIVDIVLLLTLLPLLPLIYEAFSGLFTVGSSLGVTPLLSDASKLLLCGAMFLGRVGIISLLVGVVGVHTDLPCRLPSASIIIN